MVRDGFKINPNPLARIMSEPLPSRMFVVCDPQGILVHTTVSLDQSGAVELWLEQEGVCNEIYNVGRGVRGESKRCRPSWEQFEAQGYRVIRVRLVPE